MTTEPIAVIPLAEEADTTALAEDLAAIARPGDVIALKGDLGAGKSVLARAFIRALADDPALEVPSPTFTLAQTYALPRFPVTHADLYRLLEASELAELGLEEAAAEGVLLVEWPERAGGGLSGDPLTLRLEPGASPSQRIARLFGSPAWGERVRRTRAVRAFLERSGRARAHRRHLLGDASTRAYERIRHGAERTVLMNWPPHPEGPPLKDGLSYRQLAGIAAGAPAWLAVQAHLASLGLSVPRVEAVDAAAGLILLEDLDSAYVVEAGRPVAERYRIAADLLAEVHRHPVPAELPVPGGGVHRLPRYDHRSMGIEVELLLDWYAPWRLGRRLAADAEEAFRAIWTEAFERLARAAPVLVLRDYHSPNLHWLPAREGIARIGIVDFQDALIGPAGYDVGALAYDARVLIPPELRRDLIACYVGARRARDPAFDPASFEEELAITAAQRLTKIVGLFARLAVRDGKPGYLAHLPRLAGYLKSVLAEPVLSGLRQWYETHLPEAVSVD